MTFAEEFRPDVSESEIAIFQQKMSASKTVLLGSRKRGTIKLGRN